MAVFDWDAPTGDPLADDFRNMLYVVWKHLGLPDPTPEQYDIAYYLQHGPKRKMIMGFRGVGKSWIYGAFVCWRLYRNPDWKIMVVSASKTAADSLSKFVKRLIDEMPTLNHLRARPGQQDSMIMFDVGPAKTSKDPSVKSVGITGQITGSRADEIIADDIETTNNSNTHTSRERLLELVKEFSAVIKPESGYITYLGTPQSEMSIYKTLPGRGYQIRVWPARVPEDPDKYHGYLAPMILDMIARGVRAGTPVSPRFPEHVLMEKEAEYGRSGFLLQFMLDTSLADADRYPLKLADMMVMDLDPRMGPVKLVWGQQADAVLNDLPNVGLDGDRLYGPVWMAKEMAEYTGCVMAIDPSGRGKDETAYAIVKMLHGNLFLVAAGGFSDGYSEATLRALAVLAKTHDVKHVIVEANFGDGMFCQLLKPVMNKVHPVKVEEVRHSVQKEKRIADTLEPVLCSHRLIVDKKLFRQDLEADQPYQLFYQLTRLTRDKGCLGQDDRLDALSIAVGYWVESMAKDTDRLAQDAIEAQKEEELRKFMENVLGAQSRTETTWCSF